MKTTINLKDVISAARNACEYAAEIADYSGTTYICDAISEIADNNISIYYSDISAFIAANVEAVNDAIAEFGWDGCGGDLYKAGQMAEFTAIEGELYENLSDVLRLYAADYIRAAYKLEEISADAWENIVEALEGIDNNGHLSAVEAAVDNVLTAENDADEAEITVTAVLPVMAAA